MNGRGEAPEARPLEPAGPMLRRRRHGRLHWEWAVFVPGDAGALVAGRAFTRAQARRKALRAYRALEAAPRARSDAAADARS